MASVASLIITAAQAAGIDPSIALEVATQESGLNPNVRNGAAGEIGVFQILPSSAPGVNLADLQTNINTGVGILAQNLSLFGNVQAAVAAYNCGQQCVLNAMSVNGSNWFSAIPSSTQGYTNAILGRIQNDYAATVNVPTLISPLTAGFATPALTPPTSGSGGLSVWTQAAIVLAGLLVFGFILSEE